MNKSVILLILLILVVPTVMAGTVDSVEFLYNNEPVGLISTQTSLSVVMHVTGTSQATALSLVGDVTALNKNPQLAPALMDNPFSCSFTLLENGSESDTYTCSSNLQLWVASASPEITFTLTEDGIDTVIPYTTTFSLDTTKPELAAVRTDYTYLGDYVMRSSRVTKFYIDLQDAVGTFDKLDNIWYTVANNPRDRAGKCEGMTCEGFSARECTGGAKSQVQLVYPSTDDAGNSVKTSSTSHYVLCDAKSPTLVNEYDKAVDILLPDGFYTQPKTGDTIEVSVLIEDDATGIDAEGNFSGLIDNTDLLPATCGLIEDSNRVFNCTWVLPDIKDGEHTIVISAKDSVGNSLVNDQGDAILIEHTLLVDEFVSAGLKETPLFFKPTIANSPATKGYNRVAIDLALDNGINYPLFASYSLERSNIGGSVETIHTSTSAYDCIVTDANRRQYSARKFFSDISIVNSGSAYDVANRIDFELDTIDLNIIPNSLTVFCNVSSIVRSNGEVYEEPTHVIVTTVLKFKNVALNSEHIGAKYVEDIKRREKRINSTYGQTLSTLNKALSTLSSICDITNTLADVKTIGVGLQALGIILQHIPVTKAAGDGAEKIGSQTDTIITKLMGSLIGEKSPKEIQKFIQDVCDFATCSLPINKKLQNSGKADWYFDGDTELSSLNFADDNGKDQSGWAGVGDDAANDLLGGLAIPSPKDSIISSAATLCGPGIVYHLNRYRDNSCETLLCIKEMSKYGMDATVCTQARSQFICQEFIGEAFEAIPYTRMAENLVENVQGMMKSILPKTIQYVSNNFFCKGNLNAKSETDINAKVDVKNQKDITAGKTPMTDEQKKKAAKKLKLIADAKVFICKLPEAVGTVTSYRNNKNSGKGNFNYPNNDDICAFALCNGPDCELKKSSLISEFGFLSGVGDGLEGASATLPKSNNDVAAEVGNVDDVDVYRKKIHTLDKVIENQETTLIQLEKKQTTAKRDLENNNNLDLEIDYIEAKVDADVAVDNQRNDILVNENARDKNKVYLEQAKQGISSETATRLYAEYEERLEEEYRRKAQANGNDFTSSLDEYARQRAIESAIGFDEQKYFTDEGLSSEYYVVNFDNGALVLNSVYGDDIDAVITNAQSELDAQRLIKKDYDKWQNIDVTSENLDEYMAATVTWGVYVDHEGNFDNDLWTKDRKILASNYADLINVRSTVDSEKKPSVLDASGEVIAYSYITRTDRKTGERYLSETKEGSVVADALSADYRVGPSGYLEPTADTELKLSIWKNKLMEDGHLEEAEADDVVKLYVEVESHRQKMQADANVELGVLRSRQSTLNKELKAANIELINCGGNDCPSTEKKNIDDKIKKLTTEKDSLEEDIDLLDTAVTKKDSIEDLERIKANQQATDANLDKWANGIATFVYNKGWLDKTIITNWGESDSKFNNLINNGLDTDEWKKGICSPLTRTDTSSAGNTGGVLQCTGSTCKPVLSQAAEKITANEDELIYTIVLVVGPYQSTDSEDQFKYNVFLKKTTGEMKKFFKSDLIIPPGTPQTNSLSFVSETDYSEMCIKFISGNYPPGELNAKSEYCRPIIDAAKKDSLFDTGTPIPKNSATSIPASQTLNGAVISADI